MKAEWPYPEWSQCPPGTFRRIKGRLRRRNQRQALGRLGVATLVLAVASGLWIARSPLDHGVILPGLQNDLEFAGLRCSEVIRFAQVLQDGGSLPDETLESMKAHIEECPHCESRFEGMELPIGLLLPRFWQTMVTLAQAEPPSSPAPAFIHP